MKLCRRLNTKRNWQATGGSDRKALFKKPILLQREKFKIYAIPKTTNIRLFTVNENSLAQSLWEAEPFFNLFLYKLWIDICSEALKFIYQTKANFKISICLTKRNFSSPELCEVINSNNRDSRDSWPLLGPNLSLKLMSNHCFTFYFVTLQR